MIVGIATPTLVGGDAVGNDVMGMFYSLRASGHHPKLFALRHEDILETCHQLRNFDGKVDALIYHHSINCPEGINALKMGNFHKIVKYHNITPVEFFPENSPIRRECMLGFEQNKEIIKFNVLVDSEYNGNELKKINPELKFTVIPPFTQAESLVDIEPDHHKVLPINDWNKNILMVGRIAPNKNAILGIESFAIALRTNQQMRLILAGDDSSDYAQEVRTKITQLKLDQKVILTGKVSMSHLKALYLVSDALLVTSLHEGFCVPLVEAMSLNLPIVSGSACALGETIGDAGIVVKNYNPVVFASGLNEILSNGNRYCKSGKDRYLSKFHRLCISSSFLETFKFITR